MTKSELIERIVEKQGQLSFRDVELAIKTLLEHMTQALASGDATFGHCLFMNSSTGLGKSHLTQAVVHQVLRSAPSTRLHYLTAQQFSAEMVKSIRGNSMEQFSKRYVNDCDMLLVEDVHTLTGKNKTQEELNTILDYLIKSGRRVILTWPWHQPSWPAWTKTSAAA